MPTIPNRSEDLTPAGVRKRKSRGTSADRGTSKPATVPSPGKDWNHVALQMWESTIESGQSEFFESSDYAMLYFLCDQIDYLYSTTTAGTARNRSPELIKAILSGLGDLLTSEGARRKLRMELVKPTEDHVSIVASVDQLFKQDVS